MKKKVSVPRASPDVDETAAVAEAGVAHHHRVADRRIDPVDQG